MLDFSPLARAIQTLASAMVETAGRPGDLLARDGCIQRFGFRELRNGTSHAYDPAKAAQVYAGIPAFLHEAQALIAKLAP